MCNTHLTLNVDHSCVCCRETGQFLRHFGHYTDAKLLFEQWLHEVEGRVHQAVVSAFPSTPGARLPPHPSSSSASLASSSVGDLASAASTATQHLASEHAQCLRFLGNCLSQQGCHQEA